MHKLRRLKNRVEAGRLLANKLMAYKDHPNALVLGLPRGGVPVGFEVAKALDLPLDVFLVRKLDVPGHEELAIGAITSNSEPVFQSHILQQFNIQSTVIEEMVNSQRLELLRREKLFRHNKPALNLIQKVIIAVDDGLATGSTMLAALQAMRHQNPAQLIVTVPVASQNALMLIEPLCE